MAKIDLDALSIEELAALREAANAKLLEKVAKRQAELESELERLAQYGKPAKKALVTETAKPRKGADRSEARKIDAEESPVAEAA
jgi:hypothetical protein